MFFGVFEGISHFVKVVWSAQFGRKISALELEIQAEVDKFVAAWQLLEEQGMPQHRAAQALTKLLFERYSVREEVSHEEIERYRLASRIAHRFCSNLAYRSLHYKNQDSILKAVRHFYRSGLKEMLRAGS